MKTATNPDTGERFYLDEETMQWMPMDKPRMPQGAKADPESNAALGVARSATEGMTLGWGDELGIGLAALAGKVLGPDTDMSVGDIYDDMRGVYEQEQNLFKEQHPALATTAEIGGALATGGAGAGRLAATKGGQALANLPKAAKFVTQPATGAGVGAVTGAGFANQGERTQGAIAGGIFGGALGAAVPAVVSGVKAVGNRLGAGASNPASRKVAKALSEDGLTPNMVAARLAKLGDDAVLADVPGQNLKSLADTVANMPGKGKNIAYGNLTRRDYKQGERILESIEAALGDGKKFYSALDDTMTARAAVAKPLYKQAHSRDVPLTDTLKKLMQRPSVQDALAVIRNKAREHGDELPEGVEAMPNMKGWDYVKRALDDMIEGKRDPLTRALPMTDEMRAIDATRKALLNELDRLNPDYAKARAAWSGGSRFIELMEEGKKFVLGGKGSGDSVDRALGKLNSSEQEAYRFGVARALREEIDRVGDTFDVTKRIFGNKAKRDKLRAVFPDDRSFRKFQSKVLAESEKFKTKKVLGGSPTAARQASQDDLTSPMRDMAVDAITGDARQLGSNLLRGLGRRGGRPGLAPEMSENLGRMLYDPKFTAALKSPDPRVRQMAMRMLQGGRFGMEPQAAPVFSGAMGGLLGNL